MKLFFVLVCCLAIPLVARAAHQDNQGNNKKAKRTTQNSQHQTGMQGKHTAANTGSQLNNSSHFKGQGQHQRLNTHHSNALAVQSNHNGKVATKHNSATTASQLNNSSKLKHQGQNRALNAKNNNLTAVQSNHNGKLEAKHFNLANSPNPKIQSTKFQQNYRIRGSENWQGQNYGAFQNYRGEWHDQGWWDNHYDRILLSSGGWYFWNAGYWYPAWGYNSARAYYPYNGPIYGYHNLPPDQVIANVQSTLQAKGYYRGDVDGMLGPITREALSNYQRDHGLYQTKAVDEPTLESLGMS
jgi:peptidoglycan hydrolase-like protein with peptidoglycan-binding domain